jgi:hypothetical protein
MKLGLPMEYCLGMHSGKAGNTHRSGYVLRIPHVLFHMSFIFTATCAATFSGLPILLMRKRNIGTIQLAQDHISTPCAILPRPPFPSSCPRHGVAGPEQPDPGIQEPDKGEFRDLPIAPQGGSQDNQARDTPDLPS